MTPASCNWRGSFVYPRKRTPMTLSALWRRLRPPKGRHRARQSFWMWWR
nr:MAG TPA: hypothetical protein [Caudoviricetes sp.]